MFGLRQCPHRGIAVGRFRIAEDELALAAGHIESCATEADSCAEVGGPGRALVERIVARPSGIDEHFNLLAVAAVVRFTTKIASRVEMVDFVFIRHLGKAYEGGCCGIVVGCHHALVAVAARCDEVAIGIGRRIAGSHLVVGSIGQHVGSLVEFALGVGQHLASIL